MKREILRRNTKQKKIILEVLRKTEIHPTADLLFMMIKKRIPTISFGTVYRNLNFLRDRGKILELTCGRYSCRYDGNIQRHCHFFCIRCKKVFDLNEPVLKDLDERVTKKSGMIVKYHQMGFYGYCRSCKS